DGIEIANGRAITTQYPLGIRRWEITYNPYTHGLEGYFFNENLDRLDLYVANGHVLPGEWHCVQLYLDESLNGHAEIWLDGTPEGSVSGDLSTPSPFDRMYLWNQPSAGTVWLDDIKVADAPIGGCPSRRLKTSPSAPRKRRRRRLPGSRQSRGGAHEAVAALECRGRLRARDTLGARHAQRAELHCVPGREPEPVDLRAVGRLHLVSRGHVQPGHVRRQRGVVGAR